jgi:GTPase
MFLDETKIIVESGKGGDGAVSFRREKFMPKGGPDGGDGGRGGDVILEVSPHYTTLLDLGYTRTYNGENGVKGGGNNCSGRMGKDCVVYVPAGTIVKDANGNILADLTSEGMRYVAAKGGRGGKGNTHFASSRHQAPIKFFPGKDGEKFHLTLELKLMADVGLVGFPNAGKSSLVNRISSGKPKIGDYPFTTLEPVLGIVRRSYRGSFVVADIPGLISGASEGKGLGHRFLKHIERTASLLFVIDGSQEDAYTQYQTLRQELSAFHPGLLEKPHVVALNKADLGEMPDEASFKQNKVPFVKTSAITKDGLSELIKELEKHLTLAPEGAW